MTAVQAGAPSTDAGNWNQVDWSLVKAFVFRTQVRRLAVRLKSIREERWGKAKALQHLLARSFYGRLWAVKRITANKGSRTAGVDGVTWNSPGQRWRAALNLKVRGYKALPLRRIYIPKKNGKRRPLGIPTVSDRVAQMVVKLHFEPLVEPYFHTDSYGYRPNKSAHQALEVTRKRCWRYNWVLEFDIKGLFDNIDHNLLMKAVRKHTDNRWLILYIERWLTGPIQSLGVLFPAACCEYG